MKVASLLLALTLACPVAAAQSPAVTTTQLKERTKPLRNHKKFTVEYDRFKDLTRVAVGPFRVEDGLASGVSIQAWFKFQGQSLSEINTIHLLVSRHGKDWMFLRTQALYAIIDGERAELGDGDRYSDVTRGGVSERLYYSLALDRFEQMANAKSVEMRIASKEFTLNEEHKQAFRDLLKLASR